MICSVLFGANSGNGTHEAAKLAARPASSGRASPACAFAVTVTLDEADPLLPLPGHWMRPPQGVAKNYCEVLAVKLESRRGPLQGPDIRP